MPAKGQFKHDWDKLCEEYADRRAELGTIEAFCESKGVSRWEFTRYWAQSKFYVPRIGRHSDDAKVSEGKRATDNVVLSRAEIEFFRVAKALNSPIRLALLRYLCEGPKSILQFLSAHDWSYYTVMHAMKRLHNENLVDVIGWEGEYNIYSLRDAEGVLLVLEGIERLATNKIPTLPIL